MTVTSITRRNRDSDSRENRNHLERRATGIAKHGNVVSAGSETNILT